jgi:hypothetical protein
VKILPPSSFPELADGLFVSLQFGAERVALLRSAINEAGPTAFLERRLREENDRLNQLAELGVMIYRLIPFEADVRLSILSIAGGERRVA